MADRQTKYVFVTGGVLSGLGKGIAAASLGTILKARGFLINIQKCDPYLNTDAGTLNPAEHGEVFVTADGAETDLDLGHYERFIDRELDRKSSLMNGRIYAGVIAAERAGKYLGKTVQIIPHVTTEIQRRILATGRGHDVHIVEIGGTVGDYESLAFLEAIRQFKRQVGAENVLYMHLVYLPYLEASKELKTKPAQNTLRDLRAAGISPDVVIARCERPVNQQILDKLMLFSDVEKGGIVPLPTAPTVYEVPLMLEESGLGYFVSKRLGLPKRKPKLREWSNLVAVIKQPDEPVVRIGVVAKYMDHEDTYTSVFEAVKSAAWANKSRAEIVWIDAEKLEDDENLSLLDGLDGIVVPGGFGARGVEGKIRAAAYAMRQNKPYLGLCLGMQTAVIAVARQALGTNEVNSSEIDPKVKHPVIALMADQADVTDKGGTMRLGDYPCVLDKASLSYRIYGSHRIKERHRHRYEFNNAYRERLSAAGLVLAGLSPDKRLVELVELNRHPFFVASQFHPEFKSRPNRPHPLFDSFIKASLRPAGRLAGAAEVAAR
ncbi:CTP synthase [Candidatus Parcubacteria bacterium]|nr:CTP synthase [Candidatus Parcubacteria bacterium]